MFKRVPCAILVLAVLPGAVWAQAPLGPEFQVNTYTLSHQHSPSAAFDPTTGDFIVVWDSFGQDGDGSGVYAQAYDNLGNPLIAEYQVNDPFPGSQGSADVASIGNLEMVVAWTSDGQDGYGQGVMARRVHPLGGLVGPEFQVNSYTTSDQRLPSVASDAAGNFVVVWESSRANGSSRGIFARRYDAVGNPRGVEFLVNSSTSGYERRPDVALDANGNFVVVWQGLDSFGYGIFGQRYNFSGTPVGVEFQVNTYTPFAQHAASVASAADGSFVVVWEDYLEDYPQYHWKVRGRRYDAAGAPLGSDFIVNSYTTWWARQPQVSSDAEGNFVVVWDAAREGPSGTWDGRGRRYDVLGAPGPEFRLNSYTTAHQQGVAVASLASGDFLALWASESQDGDVMGVFARRFAPDPDLIFRADFGP